MNSLLNELFKVRSMLTLSAWYVFLLLIFQGNINSDVLVGVVNILLGFYFGEKVAKQKVKVDKLSDGLDGRR